MNPLSVSKEVARLGASHGLSKDVIDLLEKKVSLLESELQESQSREKEKDSKIKRLQAQVGNLKPEGGLLDEENDILKLLAANKNLRTIDLVKPTGLKIEKIEYHIDSLIDRDYITADMWMGNFRVPSITKHGRKHLVEGGLV
ncbi:hypothetical protein QEH59_18375 [Coraliomargarita sp. SDUM461004]|uniref:Uncharacterized protein n=1 Tax=Thalassobacterium sedimentorum TaxID=3041258 RepID=A0ABU1ARK8_9BACT|nr:hypothetical protein [Coraliomargarita sp. SDUM461004]MDQ8196401.1 hypothetical protein [Coraliomargarita sp. SDUM461004]